MTVTGPTPGPTPYNPIISTAQLKPDGILGYLKAISAGLVSLLTALGIAIGDGNISKAEWITSAAVALGAALAAYAPPNKVLPTPPAPVEPADGPQI